MTGLPIPWIVIFYPVAPIHPTKIESAKCPTENQWDNTITTVTKTIHGVIKCNEVWHHISVYLDSPLVMSSKHKLWTNVASRENHNHGSASHLQRLANNMVILANDFYMDLCVRNSTVEGQSTPKYKLFIVAAESGAYLAMQLVNFYEKYGTIYRDHMQQFHEAWSLFLFGKPVPELKVVHNFLGNQPVPEVVHNIPFVLAVLIHPSCPSPIGFLGSWWHPRFYNEGPPIHVGNRNVFVGHFKPGPNTSVLKDVLILGNDSEAMWTHGYQLADSDMADLANWVHQKTAV